MMKNNVKIPANSIGIRILSVFMAFLIFTLSFQQAFIGLGSMTVRAYPTAGNGKIIQVQTYSQYMGQDGYTVSYSNDGNPNGTYTGKILPQSVSMYDYLTDYEKNNSKWNKLSNQSNYTYWNRYEPYKQFDRNISTAINEATSVSDKHITVRFKSEVANLTSTSTVFVHLINGANNNGWPGYRMIYDSVNSDATNTYFKYTFDPTALGFTPNSVIFTWSSDTYNSGSNKWNSNSDSVWHYRTYAVSQSMSAGHTYTFTKATSSNANSNNIRYEQESTYNTIAMQKISSICHMS